MSITAIYFDIGGVLVRTMDRAPRAALARRLGVTYEALEELVFSGEQGRRAQRGEITAEEQWAYVCRALNYPLETWRTLQAEFFAGDGLDAELVAAIRGLHARYRTGIISNALSDVRDAVVNHWRIADAFDVMIFSCEVGAMKPDPRIFQSALQALNVRPDEAVFVDDFAPNVEGARAMGMHAIQFRSPQQLSEQLPTILTVGE